MVVNQQESRQHRLVCTYLTFEAYKVSACDVFGVPLVPCDTKQEPRYMTGVQDSHINVLDGVNYLDW